MPSARSAIAVTLATALAGHGAQADCISQTIGHTTAHNCDRGGLPRTAPIWGPEGCEHLRPTAMRREKP